VKLLVDVNLSPRWVEFFQSLGLVALRWSDIGAINAPDSEIMAWAATNGYVIFDARSRLQHDFSP
jgi:predicted nuclease of predicted toxin-antitoxin system